VRLSIIRAIAGLFINHHKKIKTIGIKTIINGFVWIPIIKIIISTATRAINEIIIPIYV
jgi:hypothetical protein